MMLPTDSDSVLDDGKKRKQVLGKTFIPLHLSEPNKHNQNPFKCDIQNLKAGCSKTSNSCGTGVLAYHCEMMEYFFDVTNYVDQAILNNRIPYETLWGETPDISMISFKLWDPVSFFNYTNK